ATGRITSEFPRHQRQYSALLSREPATQSVAQYSCEADFGHIELGEGESHVKHGWQRNACFLLRQHSFRPHSRPEFWGDWNRSSFFRVHQSKRFPWNPIDGFDIRGNVIRVLDRPRFERYWAVSVSERKHEAICTRRL